MNTIPSNFDDSEATLTLDGRQPILVRVRMSAGAPLARQCT